MTTLDTAGLYAIDATSRLKAHYDLVRKYERKLFAHLNYGGTHPGEPPEYNIDVAARKECFRMLNSLFDELSKA